MSSSNRKIRGSKVAELKKKFLLLANGGGDYKRRTPPKVNKLKIAASGDYFYNTVEQDSIMPVVSSMNDFRCFIPDDDILLPVFDDEKYKALAFRNFRSNDSLNTTMESSFNEAIDMDDSYHAYSSVQSQIIDNLEEKMNQLSIGSTKKVLPLSVKQRENKFVLRPSILANYKVKKRPKQLRCSILPLPDSEEVVFKKTGSRKIFKNRGYISE